MQMLCIVRWSWMPNGLTKCFKCDGCKVYATAAAATVICGYILVSARFFCSQYKIWKGCHTYLKSATHTGKKITYPLKKLCHMWFSCETHTKNGVRENFEYWFMLKVHLMIDVLLSRTVTQKQRRQRQQHTKKNIGQKPFQFITGKKVIAVVITRWTWYFTCLKRLNSIHRLLLVFFCLFAMMTTTTTHIEIQETFL